MNNIEKKSKKAKFAVGFAAKDGEREVRSHSLFPTY